MSDRDPPTDPGTTSHVLARPAGTLAYDLAGRGPLVVLIPGLGELRQAYRWLAPRLSDVSVPARVLMGGRDPDFPDPAAEAEGVAQALGGRAEVLADVGHYPHLEVPEAMAERLLAFADEIGHHLGAGGSLAGSAAARG